MVKHWLCKKESRPAGLLRAYPDNPVHVHLGPPSRGRRRRDHGSEGRGSLLGFSSSSSSSPNVLGGVRRPDPEESASVAGRAYIQCSSSQHRGGLSCGTLTASKNIFPASASNSCSSSLGRGRCCPVSKLVSFLAVQNSEVQWMTKLFVYILGRYVLQ